MIYVKKGYSNKTQKNYYALCLFRADKDKEYVLSFDKILICNLLGCSFEQLSKLFATTEKIEI